MGAQQTKILMILLILDFTFAKYDYLILVKWAFLKRYQ